MDTAVPTTPNASPYTWQDADPAATTPTPSMDGGPQVSQPAGDGNTLVASGESARAATVRRVATGVVGLGLVAAAALATRGLRGANARAGANVIDYDD